MLVRQSRKIAERQVPSPSLAGSCSACFGWWLQIRLHHIRVYRTCSYSFVEWPCVVPHLQSLFKELYFLLSLCILRGASLNGTTFSDVLFEPGTLPGAGVPYITWLCPTGHTLMPVLLCRQFWDSLNKVTLVRAYWARIRYCFRWICIILIQIPVSVCGKA